MSTSQSSPGRPKSTGSSSNEQILKEAVEAGPAKYGLPEEIVEAAGKFSTNADVHPMVLLGVTIQYMKLVGGRMAAHLLLEEVYSAFQAMVGDGVPKVGEENWSQPWPLNSVEVENQELKKRVAELEKAASGT